MEHVRPPRTIIQYRMTHSRQWNRIGLGDSSDEFDYEKGTEIDGINYVYTWGGSWATGDNNKNRPFGWAVDGHIRFYFRNRRTRDHDVSTFGWIWSNLLISKYSSSHTVRIQHNKMNKIQNTLQSNFDYLSSISFQPFSNGPIKRTRFIDVVADVLICFRSSGLKIKCYSKFGHYTILCVTIWLKGVSIYIYIYRKRPWLHALQSIRRCNKLLKEENVVDLMSCGKSKAP